MNIMKKIAKEESGGYNIIIIIYKNFYKVDFFLFIFVYWLKKRKQLKTPRCLTLLLFFLLNIKNKNYIRR